MTTKERCSRVEDCASKKLYPEMKDVPNQVESSSTPVPETGATPRPRHVRVTSSDYSTDAVSPLDTTDMLMEGKEKETTTHRETPPTQQQKLKPTESCDNTDADASCDSVEKAAALPLHDEVDPPNTYMADMDVKVAILTQRNKRVLLARLVEVAPRGRLSVINLCRRGLGVEEATLLKEAIVHNPHLCVLKLAYNNLGDDGASIIATSILHDGIQHHRLSVLDLGFNGIGDVGCGCLAVHCLAGNPNMQTLYLSGNQICEKGALAIGGAILHGSGLRRLFLSANSIGSTGTKAIAGAIAKNDARLTRAAVTGEIDLNTVHRTEELHLGHSSIGADGFIAIPSMLLSNTSLKKICLSGNNLDDADMLLLSQALTQNKLVPLEALHLSCNEISCQGVECLMNSVWGSTCLRDLKLDNNHIKDRGAQLCAVVLTSVALVDLDLSFNAITTSGLKAIMKNLSDNTSLRQLGLAGISIDQNASKAVSYALAYNTSLKSLHLDNCSTGYASQRHIVAGVVSNRKSSLRVLTGFNLSRIAMTLGMPRLPESWSNDQVLGFVHLMWQQWLLKSRHGGQKSEDMVRGPAPPAAVAAAAKIAFSSLGNQPDDLFRTELHEKPLSERASIEPAGAALMERTDSGTMIVPMFRVSSEIGIHDFVDGESKVAAMANKSPARILSTVRSPMENLERKNKNLQWLRLHFRALSEISRLPFHNADLWQLHQFYFSPPFYPQEGAPSANDDDATVDSPVEESSMPEMGVDNATDSISFQKLETALSNTDTQHKRSADQDELGPVAKRSKNLKPRIAYYPRIMTKIQSLGTKPMDQTLALFRQLKYTESTLFGGKNPYTEVDDSSFDDDPSHADIDMILLDLL